MYNSAVICLEQGIIFYRSYFEGMQEIADTIKKRFKNPFFKSFPYNYLKRIDQKILHGLINHFGISDDSKEVFLQKMLIIKSLWSMQEQANIDNFSLIRKICTFSYPKVNNMVLFQDDPFERIASNFIRVAPTKSLELISPGLLLDGYKKGDTAVKLSEAVLREIGQRNNHSKKLLTSNLMLLRQLQEERIRENTPIYTTVTPKVAASPILTDETTKEVTELKRKLKAYEPSRHQVGNRPEQGSEAISKKKKTKPVANKIRE